MKNEITTEQKAEIKAVLENMAVVFTDGLSQIWEQVGLNDPPQPNNQLEEEL